MMGNPRRSLLKHAALPSSSRPSQNPKNKRNHPSKGDELDPLKLPTRLQTALQALYGHYEKTFKLWEDSGIKVPPCFIIVCQNTAFVP